MQRHWKGAVVWAFIAGIGYLSIPERYYDQFVDYYAGDDYEEAATLLSGAALEDEDESYVARARPPAITYRYRAERAPIVEQEKQCFLRHFVDRRWNMPFVHVSIPIDGVESNVTVPEDYYDAFVEQLAKPDFATACRILAEAAARDTTPPADFGEAK